MTSVQKMVNKLRLLGYKIGDPYKFRRTMAGRHQRSVGVWSWCIYWEHGEIGSCDTVANILKAKEIYNAPNCEIGVER